MTVEAQRPTGRPGDSPTGPAGPGPSGPAGPRPNQPTPRPDTQAPPPASPKQLAEVLDTFDLLLRSMQVLDACELGAADPADRMRLTYALDLGRRAVADLNSGREGRSAAAVSRPVQLRAGRRSAAYCFCPSLAVGHEYHPQYCKGSAPAGYAAGPERPMLPVRPTKNVEPEVADEDGVPRGDASGARFRAAKPRAGRPPSPGAGHDFRLPRDVRAAT